MSKLIEFVKKHSFDSLVPTVIKTKDGKDYLQFHDGHLQFMNREDLETIVKELTKTLELDNSFDEYIEENNAYQLINTFPCYTKYDSDKFNIPFDRLRISKKEFKQDKRKWSFTCGNCSTKISSTEKSNYISIVPDYPFKDKSERACSLGCARVIAKDKVLDWLNEQKYPNFFYTDNLSEQLEHYLETVK